MLLTGAFPQPFRNEILLLDLWPCNDSGHQPYLVVRAVVFVCLFLSKDCGALCIIKPLFACWTCMGKGQKLLCVTVDTPFFLRETKVVLLTMGKMSVVVHTGKKPKSQNNRQMKQGRFFSITQRSNIFWFIHEKKQVMCTFLPHWTYTFWVSTEEKKKSQTNYIFCLMLCRLSKWWYCDWCLPALMAPWIL